MSVDLQSRNASKQDNSKVASSWQSANGYNYTVLIQQLIAVLKLRLSISNILISDERILKNITDHFSRIDMSCFKMQCINKLVEDIFNIFLNEAKLQELTGNSSNDTTLSSITFNPSNKDIKWGIETDSTPVSNALTKMIIQKKKDINRKKKLNKPKMPMKFSKDKECSIPQLVFFQSTGITDFKAINERAIEQVMNKASLASGSSL